MHYLPPYLGSTALYLTLGWIVWNVARTRTTARQH
jgi:hypothetical protein